MIALCQCVYDLTGPYASAMCCYAECHKKALMLSVAVLSVVRGAHMPTRRAPLSTAIKIHTSKHSFECWAVEVYSLILF